MQCDQARLVKGNRRWRCLHDTLFVVQRGQSPSGSGGARLQDLCRAWRERNATPQDDAPHGRICWMGRPSSAPIAVNVPRRWEGGFLG